MKNVSGDETRTSISSSSDQEEACLQLAPGRAWTPFLVTPWLSLAPRTCRHPECHSLLLSSCSDVKNIQIAGVFSRESAGEGLVLCLRVCCVTVPSVGPPWEVGVQRETIFVCLPWPSNLFFCHLKEENTGLLPVGMEAVGSVSAQRATHRPGLGSHTHSPHLTGHVS